MKGFGVILLCVFATAQGLSTGVHSTSGTAAGLGENPWLVHIRIAVSTSGLLNSCVGSLYNSAWIITAASCVQDARFIWLRYGAVNVVAPSLVTESSTVRLHPEFDPSSGANDIALISINRVVQSTDNISPIGLAASDSDLPSSGTFCGYGSDDGRAGEQLSCSEFSLESGEDGSIVASSEDSETTEFDLGGPLVSDGAQYGVLVQAGESSVFLPVAGYADWIEEVTAASSD